MFHSWIRFAVRRTPLYAGLRFFRDRAAERAWLTHPERPGPAPHRVKTRTLREYAQRYGMRTLIETGTFYGDTIWRLRNDFDRIVSIEIDPTLAAEARKRFKRHAHIEIVAGDSGIALEEVLGRTFDRCLFWLDGHYSGGITGRGELDCPLVNELRHIWNHRVKNHVILVDDAREFIGVDGYPTIGRLEATVKRQRPEWSFAVESDIIRICPPIRPAVVEGAKHELFSKLLTQHHGDRLVRDTGRGYGTRRSPREHHR